MDVTHSPCGGKLVTVSMDRYAHVFDVSGWSEGDPGSITTENAICKIPTGHSDTVSHHNLYTNERALTKHPKVYGVAYHPSGNYFGTVSADKTLKMWRCVLGEHDAGDRHADLIASFATRHTDRIRGMAYNFDDSATVSEDGCVCVTAVEKIDLFRFVW
jgi:WD40 repeat protein